MNFDTLNFVPSEFFKRIIAHLDTQAFSTYMSMPVRYYMGILFP